ncbi:MAG: hypothetical protein OEZ01_02645 [Candidatus Heimdallarchaeota archaeon]|nr:hypothetical protein [Candidatus Heimdallarchaeota archaeon]MDH5644875.1 hypothetical protein [Candidatus Heimdallarchaeota archaeon]
MEKTRISLILIILFYSGIIISISTAHVPVNPDQSEGLATATRIDDPTKSWVIYGESTLDQLTQYFYFDILAFDTLFLSFTKAIRDENMNYNPKLILFGVEFNSSEVLDSHIEIPEGYGWIIISDEVQEKIYEPFGPSYYDPLGLYNYTTPSDARYYLAITAESEGFYSIAIGLNERYSLIEWITVPLSMVNVYLWEGQSILFLLLPWVITIGIGYFLIKKYQLTDANTDYKEKLFILIIALSNFCSSLNFFSQILISMYKSGQNEGLIISIVIGILPALTGLMMVRSLVLSNNSMTRLNQKLTIYSIINLLIWAGFVIFPLISLMYVVWRVIFYPSVARL